MLHTIKVLTKKLQLLDCEIGQAKIDKKPDLFIAPLAHARKNIDEAIKMLKLHENTKETISKPH